jgi:hypothetical protein
LGSKIWECKFIGYVENGSGYRFYHPNKRLIKSKDAAFLEYTNQITPMDEIRLLQGEDLECQTPQDTLTENEHNTNLQDSGSKRKSNDSPHLVINNQNSESKRQRRPSITLKDHYVLSTNDVNWQEDLANFKEAVTSHDAGKWIKAMNEELESI